MNICKLVTPTATLHSISINERLSRFVEPDMVSSLPSIIFPGSYDLKRNDTHFHAQIKERIASTVSRMFVNTREIGKSERSTIEMETASGLVHLNFS